MIVLNDKRSEGRCFLGIKPEKKGVLLCLKRLMTCFMIYKINGSTLKPKKI